MGRDRRGVRDRDACHPSRRRGSLAVVPVGSSTGSPCAQKSLQAVHVPAAPLSRGRGGSSTRRRHRAFHAKVEGGVRAADPEIRASRACRAPRVWREERRAEDQIEASVSLKTLQERIASRPTAAEANRIFCERGNEIRAGARRSSSTVRGTIKPRRAAAHERERGTRPRGGRRHPGGVDRVPR